MRKRKANINAIVDSNGNQHDGDIYKAGKLQTIYSYSKVLDNTVYYKGTKVYMPEYEDVNNGNPIYYTTSDVNRRGTERKKCLYNCTKYEGKLYDADGEQVNRYDAYYYGTWADVLYESGSKLTKATGFKRIKEGEQWSYTPIGSAANNLYERQPDDDYQVTLLGEKCSLQLSELSTKNVSALITSVATEE